MIGKTTRTNTRKYLNILHRYKSEEHIELVQYPFSRFKKKIMKAVFQNTGENFNDLELSVEKTATGFDFIIYSITESIPGAGVTLSHQETEELIRFLKFKMLEQ